METSPLKRKVVNISEVMDSDLVVFTGVILDTLEERGPDSLLRASGGYRGLQESKVMTWVEGKLKKLKPEGLFPLFRDSEAYERYGDYFEFSYGGVCPAFFIDE